MRELPRGTVTFLFTDIEGSTKLLHELGDGYADVLAEHRRLLRKAFAAHDGVEVDTQGDAFFVAFARAADALVAADEAQRELGTGPVRVRMGIHSGDPVVTEEGYAGLDVHRAARICSTAHGGQIIVSESTRALIEDEAQLKDVGLHRLKDLTEPVKLFQLGDGEFPPLRSLNATNLPSQASPLVGRERELSELQALVRDSRVVTLTGAGGSGKTRLALQAAAELVDDFKDGVFWVSLAVVTDPELVLPTIEQTLGAKVPLTEHLDEKRLLLLLDNLEQVIDCAPSLSGVVSACPNLCLLATSREPLRVAGEREYEVEPLPEDDAVTLFRQRAVLAEPIEAVREICRRLDGLPLAVELAAARTRILPPDQLLERLGRALPLLTRGRVDAPERQRTLRATIQWSYELLSPGEQRVFRRTGVFAGSFDPDAAEAVCDAELDSVESLVEKSLVRRWQGGRLGMLATIYEYAAEQFEASREADDLRRRHAEHFRALVVDEQPRLRRLDEEALAAMNRLSDELGNIRAALEWLVANEAEDAVQMLRATTAFWIRGGRADEGHSWSDRVLAGLRTDSPARREALEIAGRFAGIAGHAERPAARKTPALELARAEGDDAAAGRLLVTLGEVAAHRRLFDSAERRFEEALPLLRASDDHWAIAFAVAGLSRVAEGRGNLDEASRLLDDAVAHAESRNLLNLPPLLCRAGRLALDQGDDARAEHLFRSALDLAVRWKQVLTVDSALAGIAAARAIRGDGDGAVRACEAVAALSDGPRAAASAFEDYADYLEGVALPADARRRMTVEEAIEHALADV